MNKLKGKKGFTLIEILVVIGIIAVLAAIVIIAINPARQFAQSRDTQRVSNLDTILNSVGQRMADNKGLFRLTTDAVCTSAMDLPIPMATATISSTGINLRPCLVPTYIPELPVDPTVGTAWNGTTYDTGYSIMRDNNGRIHLIATTTEPSIPRTAQLETVR